ncbi:uncharacterized protein C4orf19 homolog [Notamacropus eugenii]|uniref:uncharacterized protein C4orf19 homolog n=1 Tax=Notamacropus eugenii TaxID=9315 RepID=UPI003B66C08B
MGCRCCKMIQSYFFDPVHAPPTGYVNEVNIDKSEEEDGMKINGKENSETLVHKNDLQNEELQRTETKNRLNSAQEPFWHHRGPPIHEDHAGNSVTETDPTLNGIGSNTAVSPDVNPSLSQEKEITPHESGSGSLARAASDGDPAEHFVKESDPGGKDPMHQATEETQVILNGDSQASGESASSSGSNHMLEVQNHILPLPVPDYPQVEVQVINQIADENYSFLSNHIQAEPMDGVDYANGDHISDLSFSKRRSWNSLNEAIKTEALTINFNEDVSEHDWSPEQEDAAVAEALAALEAATAGEDGEEGY